jgi:murein endopeptidase
VLRGALTALAACALAVACAPADEPIEWHRSASTGTPDAGRLADGVELPEAGSHFFTWHPVERRSPNPRWRRYGSDTLVRMVLRVVDEYAAAHPDAPRVGIGDLSRPHGGPFGPKHVSHQNGLDVDVYLPRRDRLERPPGRPSQIDRPLAQDLVDRFVRAGAVKVFVGPRTALRGPRRVVQVVSGHDNHVHVRVAAPPPRTTTSNSLLLGRSQRGRPIYAYRLGGPSRRRILVVGCIHGTECAGTAIVSRLRARARNSLLQGTEIWLISDLNPDGRALGVRQNGRGVDLNRNFGSEWRTGGRRWDPEYPGPRPWSERETRIARALILRLRPAETIWFHQPQGLVRAWGLSVPAARRYARLVGEPFRALRWPHGTAPNWQNHRFPGAAAYVVELPPGPLSNGSAERHAAAILELAR